MTEIIKWTSQRISRRRFLRTGAAGAFATMAGLSVGVPKALASTCCTGPYGSGYCGSILCTYGHNCQSQTPNATCQYVYGFCPSGTPCWSSYSCSGTCCDCYCCTYYGSCFYCYCHDGGA